MSSQEHKMDENDKIATLERILDWQLQHISKVEEKVSISFAFLAGLIAFSFSYYIRVLLHVENNIEKLIIILLAMGLIVGFLYLVSVVVPSFKQKHLETRLEKNEEDSLIYFRSISKKSVETFEKEFDNMMRKDYYDDLLEQVYNSSIIANNKYSNFKKAVNIIVYSYVFITIFVLINVFKIGGI